MSVRRGGPHPISTMINRPPRSEKRSGSPPAISVVAPTFVAHTALGRGPRTPLHNRAQRGRRVNSAMVFGLQHLHTIQTSLVIPSVRSPTAFLVFFCSTTTQRAPALPCHTTVRPSADEFAPSALCRSLTQPFGPLDRRLRRRPSRRLARRSRWRHGRRLEVALRVLLRCSSMLAL